jgi:hypothetical protein
LKPMFEASCSSRATPIRSRAHANDRRRRKLAAIAHRIASLQNLDTVHSKSIGRRYLSEPQVATLVTVYRTNPFLYFFIQWYVAVTTSVAAAVEMVLMYQRRRVRVNESIVIPIDRSLAISCTAWSAASHAAFTVFSPKFYFVVFSTYILREEGILPCHFCKRIINQ